MNNITIFADSSVGMLDSIKNRVKLLPLYVYFDSDRVYNEINGITRENFFKTLEKEQAYTSGCNPGDVEDLLREEFDKGNDILVFSVSSGLSSTYNTIKMISEMINEEALDNNKNNKIKVVDTKSINAGASFLIEKAIELIDNNKNIEEVYEEVIQEVDKIELYFIVDDLKYLARGGRISKSVAAIGDVLNIKPILYFNKEGKIDVLNKVRGLKIGINNLSKILESKENNRVVIAKAHNDTLCDLLKSKSGVSETVELDLVITSHTGPNAVAFIVYRK